MENDHSKKRMKQNKFETITLSVLLVTFFHSLERSHDLCELFSTKHSYLDLFEFVLNIHRQQSMQNYPASKL